MRAAWITDPHLNFVDEAGLERFFDAVAAADAASILLGGDVGEAASFGSFLRELAEHLRRPIYFVLGNHDYYGGSIEGVRGVAEAVAHQSEWLRWLPRAGVVELSEVTGLVGHGGWADGRLGSSMRSPLVLNDYVRIRDFIALGLVERFAKLAALGDEAAAYFETTLPEAARRFGRVIVLTHVPPFREATWHEGEVSGDDWLPHFGCESAGDAMVAVADAHPECDFTVLCGHTHGGGEVRIRPNLLVRTGSAAYGHPCVTGVLEV